jgi:hypothetical protein
VVVVVLELLQLASMVVLDQHLVLQAPPYTEAVAVLVDTNTPAVQVQEALAVAVAVAAQQLPTLAVAAAERATVDLLMVLRAW